MLRIPGEPKIALKRSGRAPRRRIAPCVLTVDQPSPFVMERTSPRSAIITIPVERWTDWSFYALLTADHHHDNAYSRHDLIKKHLEQARERNAAIFGMGDLFDAMQDPSDKRQSKTELRAENKVDVYWDSLIDSVFQMHAPFGPWWAYAGDGNHEIKARKRHGIGLIEGFCRRMRMEAHSQILGGPVNNWVTFRFLRGTECHVRRLWWHHGYAGGGQVTQDLIQAYRQRTYIQGADIMVSGHVHRSWQTDVDVECIGQDGKPARRTIWILKLPTYKDAYGQGGYEDEQGHDPRPLGAWWVRFYWEIGKGIEIEPTRAR